MNSEEILIQKLQDHFPDYKIEKGAPMKYTLRGSEYEVLHQLLPRCCLVDGFDAADIFRSMLNSYLTRCGGGDLISIRTIESGIDAVTNDFYFYFRLCREYENSPVIHERCSDGQGYKLIAEDE